MAKFGLEDGVAVYKTNIRTSLQASWPIFDGPRSQVIGDRFSRAETGAIPEKPATMIRPMKRNIRFMTILAFWQKRSSIARVCQSRPLACHLKCLVLKFTQH